MRKLSRVGVRLSVSEMEVKLPLSVFVLLIQVSLAVWQRVTIMKGQTLSLSCPISNAHKYHVDWKNPESYTMFFNQQQALRDKRYSIIKLSESEFSISISNVTFKDGGNYTCSLYDHNTIEKKVEVTVLGHPRMSVTRHEGKIAIKCTAEANHLPPQISWKFDNGSEFFVAQANNHQEGKKFVSESILHLRSVKNRVTVKCLVRHSALHSRPLMNFVKIGRNSKSSRSTTSSPTTQPQGSSGVQGTTTSWFRHGRTTVYFTTGNSETLESSTAPSDQQVFSSDSQTVTAPTEFPLNPDHVSTSDAFRFSVSPDSPSMTTDTISDATGSAGWTSVNDTTEDLASFNSTERNRTGSFDSDMQKGTRGNAALLIVMVTCLIFGLLVVVFFFAIKLRKAHIAWKRENEDFDPSEESSKSKSSQEEKNSQGQRGRGLFKTTFAQYVTEQPTMISSVQNPAALTAPQSTSASGPQTPTQTSIKCDVKETAL